MVLDTGADGRRLPAWCPRTFERADQGKPAFIGKNQRGTQRVPLFLYAARHSVSNERRLHRRARTCAVAVFGNSTPSVATHAKHRSADSARETVPRSGAQCGLGSSNLRYSHRPKPLAVRPAPNGVAAKGIIDWAARVHADPACAWVAGTRDANVAHSVWSRRSVWQPGLRCVRVVTKPGRADDVEPAVWSFQKVSCLHYRT